MRAAVGGDVDADALTAEEFPQPLTRLLRLQPAPPGQGQGVIGFALIDGVINIAR
ncbi:hypothetical protein GCM10010415_68850 [Streptomyces atrovirens]